MIKKLWLEAKIKDGLIFRYRHGFKDKVLDPSIFCRSLKEFFNLASSYSEFRLSVLREDFTGSMRVASEKIVKSYLTKYIPTAQFTELEDNFYKIFVPSNTETLIKKLM